MSKNIYKEWAKKYLEKGYSVIPDKPNSKKPAISAWTDYCYNKPSEEDVNNWSKTFTESNISVTLGEASKIIALDFDSDDAAVRELVVPLLPDSPVEKVSIKKGRFTRFFRYHGEALDSFKYNGNMVIEILSNGKKTTLPPSNHPNGGQYKWSSEKQLLDVSSDDLPLLPPYLISQIQSIVTSTLGADLESYGKVNSGRNSELGTFLGKLLNNSTHTADQVIKDLISHDKEINDPPYFTDINEHRHTCEYTNALEFYSSHLNSINAKRMRENKEFLSPVFEAVNDMDAIKERARKKSQGKVEQKSLKKAESILADSAIKTIYETINKNSWIPQPELALGSALAILATLGSRKFTFQGLSPNLYICNISESGTGKNAALDFTRRLFARLKSQYLLGAGDYVSNASLVDSLPLRPTRLDVMDEVGGKLKTMNSGRTEYADKIGDILAELYTSSNSYYMGRALAAQNGVPTVRGACDKPNVNILSATTPTGFREGVTKDAIAKGLMGRFLLFFGDPRNSATRVKQTTDLPIKTLGHLEKLAKFNYKKNPANAMSEEPEEICDIKSSVEADALLDRIFSEFDQLRLEKIGSPEAPIAARLYQQMVKLCIIHSISRPFEEVPQIEVVDVEFAYSLIKCYYEELEEIIKKYIFNSKLEKDKFEVLDFIKSKGVVSHYELVRHTPQFNARNRDALIDELLQAEFIASDIDTDKDLGKRIVKYYIREI